MTTFDNFLKISKHFPKISSDSPKVVQRPDKHFHNLVPRVSHLTVLLAHPRGAVR